MKWHWPLRIFMPLGILLGFMSILLLSIWHSIEQREQQIINELRANAQSNIAQLARHAERFMPLDPQLMEEEIGQHATNRRIKTIFLIDPKRIIRFANHYAWRNTHSDKSLSYSEKNEIEQALTSRFAVIKQNSDELMLAMSYAAPSEQKQIRGLERGVIYIMYDLSQIYEEARYNTLNEHKLEFGLAILGSLLLIWILHITVTRPLEQIRNAAQTMSQGNFIQLKKKYGTAEIHSLSVSFNHMSQQLAEHVVNLADQAEQTQAIIDNMVDGLITINQYGIITSYNPSAQKIFGYNLEEVLGKNVNMLMPNPYRNAHDSYIQNYLATRIARIIGIGREVQGMRKNGEIFPMELAISELNQKGQPTFIGMVRDISERKQIERLKSEFVSAVSHELRTPLTSISGALGLLVNGVLGTLPTQAQQMLNIAHKNSQRLIFLINDLLDMEKLIAGKMFFDMKPYNLRVLIEQALEAHRTYGAERSVAINFVPLQDDIDVKVDQQRLMQVFSNLLSNAIKYSPSHGIVEVVMNHHDDKVRVSVIDHGTGIPKEFHSKIFQKFSQADSSDTRQKGGTGLGLAITKELIERMDGYINFFSIEGQGATFFFDLPIYDATQKYTTKKSEPDKPNVLHIENDITFHQQVKSILQEQYNCDLACNKLEAQQQLASQQYHLIILDLGLPDGTGWDLLPFIKQQQENAKVLILSGTEFDMEDIHKVQATLLKSKFTAEKLLNTIHQHCHISMS